MPSSSQDKKTQMKTGVSAAAGILFLYIAATVCTSKWCGWQMMGEEKHHFYNQHIVYKAYSAYSLCMSQHNGLFTQQRKQVRNTYLRCQFMKWHINSLVIYYWPRSVLKNSS